MADVTIEGAMLVTSDLVIGPRYVAATSTTNQYAFFVNSSADFQYRKSTDAGASWGSAVDISGAALITFSGIWYDKWTPGDTGGKIHTAWVDNNLDDVLYANVDTASADAITGPVTTTAGASLTGTAGYCSITKARGGNLYIAFDGDNGAETGFLRSTDGGANWTTRSNLFEASGDRVMLMPSNSGDTNDICAMYWDADANEISVKLYDDSANAWTEKTDASMGSYTQNVTWQSAWCASMRASDKHIIFSAQNSVDAAGSDAGVWDIDAGADSTGTTITAKTNLFTNQDDTVLGCLCINQNTNRIYAAVLGSAAAGDVLTATVNGYYFTSDDGGGTWSGATQFTQDTADDYRTLSCDLGGTNTLFAPCWFDDDDNDLFVNATNAVPIAAAAASTKAPWHYFATMRRAS